MLIGAILIAGGSLSCAKAPTGPNDNTWGLLAGHVEPLEVPEFRGGRPCWVYLPPGYQQSTERYPVLYVNDGWAAFDTPAGVHINRICEEMIRGRRLRPIIVVAISPVSVEQRLIDYVPPQGRFPDARGDLYLDAVCDTLKPEVDRRFRTLPDRANTAMTGFSLGGLISVYAGFARPETFGKFAGFSPSYLRGDTLYSLIQNYGCQLHAFRFYQDTGYPHDNSIWSIERHAMQYCFYPGVNFMSITVTDAEHSVRAWQHRFEGMLTFLYTPQPYWDDWPTGAASLATSKAAPIALSSRP